MKKHIVTILLVPQIKNHLSSFEFGFLNIFSRQNLLRSLSLVLSLLHHWKYGTKNVQKTTFDSTLVNQKPGKTIEKPFKELPWNQQNTVQTTLDVPYKLKHAVIMFSFAEAIALLFYVIVFLLHSGHEHYPFFPSFLCAVNRSLYQGQCYTVKTRI